MVIKLALLPASGNLRVTGAGKSLGERGYGLNMGNQ
jgi:hypothetical protein